MIDMKEYASGFVDFINWFNDNKIALVIEACFILSDETKQRVINTSKNAKGGDIGDYSEDYYNIKNAKNRINPTLERKIDYSDTREMYETVFPRIESFVNNRIIVSIKADDSVRRDGSGLTNAEVMKFLEMLTDRGKHNGYPIEFSLEQNEATTKYIIEQLHMKMREFGIA